MDDLQINDSEFKQLRELIYSLTGISLSDAKRHLVQARLRKRLIQYQMSTFQDYYDMVVSHGANSAELTELINSITTNKTDFFREPHHFKFVAEKFLPDLLKRSANGTAPRRIRIWHAGCSTGEEPYTMAMTLANGLEGKGIWDVRLLASDIDTSVLQHAQQGVYEEERVTPIPDIMLRKYFLKGRGQLEGCVQVGSKLQEMITFRQINLLDEHWPIRSDVQFDIIFCRNVTIYFDKPTRQKLVAKFVNCLKPGGFFIIGHSESLLGISDVFQSQGGTIYRLPETYSVVRAAA